jgi:hypothetical protein
VSRLQRLLLLHLPPLPRAGSAALAGRQALLRMGSLLICQ